MRTALVLMRVTMGVLICGGTVATNARAAAPCAGDCDESGAVTIDELLKMVNVALGSAAASACIAGDASGDGDITIDEILKAVNNALSGCGGMPDPTPTPALRIDVSGSWSGSFADSKLQGTVRVDLVQTNFSVVGSVLTQETGAVGDLTGNVASQIFTFRLDGGRGGSCVATLSGLTATLSDSSMSGTYSGTDACLGDRLLGVFLLERTSTVGACPQNFQQDTRSAAFSCSFVGIYNPNCGTALASSFFGSGAAVAIVLTNGEAGVFFAADVVSATSAVLTGWFTQPDASDFTPISGTVVLADAGTVLALVPTVAPFAVGSCPFVRHDGFFTGTIAHTAASAGAAVSFDHSAILHALQGRVAGD